MHSFFTLLSAAAYRLTELPSIQLQLTVYLHKFIEVNISLFLIGGTRARRSRLGASRHVALTVELVGVLVVGAISYAAPEAFPDKTVWSHFGSGYGYVPLLLPVLGLWWIRHTRGAEATAPPGATTDKADAGHDRHDRHGRRPTRPTSPIGWRA